MLSKHSGRGYWRIAVIAAWIVGGVATGPAKAGHYFSFAAAPLSDVVEVKFDE